MQDEFHRAMRLRLPLTPQGKRDREALRAAAWADAGCAVL